MKRLMQCWLVILLTLAFAQAALAVEQLNIISTPFGTSTYVIGSAIEAIVNQNPQYGLKVNHTETPGQIFNLRKLNADKDAARNTICAFSKSTNWLAREGRKPFKQKGKTLMLIANCNVFSGWLVSEDPELTTVESLAGKSIALGRIAQTVWGFVPSQLLKYGYDENLTEKASIQFVGTKPAATALLDRQVDAAIIGGYFNPINKMFSPAPQTVEVMAAGRKLHHIPWGKAAVEKTDSIMKTGYLPMLIPAGTIDGMDEDIWSFTDNIAFGAMPDMPEELAYTITKAIIEHVDEFREYHNLGKLMSAEALVYGWPVSQIHPGALRAYKEAGILK
ncbi:MAG: TAXI family TRAP transporter solute-binding subunit [Pseudodesulfovibrio sp.]|uniref:TAXI family TRAP transporter solute-binding subunit n=1 Tax=Pseudodesulfovibrio sp. TaxID=2035812 RepID=UPI003D0D850D